MPLHPKKILTHYDLKPKKSLGQNFLWEDDILQKIVDAGAVTSHDYVLEIGPGLGALTQQLAQTAKSVTAVELDQRYLPILKTELEPYDNVTIIHGDILEQNLDTLFDTDYKIIANVPSYITGAILRHVLNYERKPTTVVMTVQKEVADRVVAAPPKMSMLAVSVQVYGNVKKLDDIKAGAFWPRPDVDSAVIRIDVEPNKVPENEKAFFRVVKAGFSQKRKQLQKNLRQLTPDRDHIYKALESANIDPQRRAETLTISEWQALTNEMTP